MASNIAHAIFRWDGKLECSFPYSKYLVEQLKAHIPASHREWNPEHKLWIVDSVYATTALRLMRDTFGDVRLDDQRFQYQEPSPPFTAAPKVDPDCATLYLLPEAPRCVIDAAFKALAREYHPDRLPAGEREHGHERMVQINSAYERVRERMAS